MAANTATLPVGGTVVLLDIGAYTQNSYFVRNANVTGSITVTVEIAPIENNSYYIASTCSAVAASGNYVAAISTLMRCSRLRLETGASAAGIVAYYNGRA